MILYYTLDFNDYNMIQLFYGDWKDNPSFIINGQEMAKEFRPSDLHGLQNGDDGVTEITFSDNVFDIILQKGIVFQGHGLRLKKVELAVLKLVSSLSSEPQTAMPPSTTSQASASTLPAKGSISRTAASI